MKTKPQVFISSTSDLAPERQALADALRPEYEPYLFEQDRARRSSPEEHCATMIRNSEVFLGVVGSSYGSAYSPEEERSICEWEFDTASAQPEMAMMMLLHKVAEETALDPRQQRFRERLTDFRTGVWCRFFDSTQELVSLARRSLTQWLVERFIQTKAAAEQRRGWLRRLTVPLAIAVVFVFAVVVAADFVSDFLAPKHIVALSGLTLSMLALLYLLNRMEGGSDNAHG